MLDIPPVVKPFALLKDREMTVREVAMLGIIAANPGHSVKEVAATLGIGKPIVTRGTQKMEQHGLLSRGADTTDGRKRVLVVSDAGKELLRQLEAR
jgi:DNA-binding MarR family transcriptional regulator